MATFVADASAAVKWGLNESNSDAARRLTAHQLLAPRCFPMNAPFATMRPLPSPSSGHKSMIQSAVLVSVTLLLA